MRGLFCLLLLPMAATAQEVDFKSLLAKPILPPRHTLTQTQKFLEDRLPPLPRAATRADWETQVARLRKDLFEKVVFRGEAARWREAKRNVVWGETAPGEGYQIKKLRYEALPGLWIPAVLYEPTKLEGKGPATLNVMGHDGGGKDVAYQQTRCINLAKRGILALNVEWFAFGQLAGPGFRHGTMNQLDLCGTSGLAPFYLSLERGLDVLLSHPSADPERVAVSGLSGGGWQTIYISALDPRVTLTNPVAGYSSFRTRIQHWKDLGDSEQTPCDMATVADYDHLTAMLAPRSALLTYNAKDNCCFEAGYALPRLYDGALPFYNLFARGEALRTHINHVPGTHNYEQENREAFYRMIGDHFFARDKTYRAEEIPCAKEIKNRKDLAVEMPANLDFNKLALKLSASLPKDGGKIPLNREALLNWQKIRRAELAELVRFKPLAVKAAKGAVMEKNGVRMTPWQLHLGSDWTVPVLEVTRGPAKKTTLLVHDAGRAGAAKEIEALLAAGQRVLAVDPFYIGESAVAERAYLWALLVGAVGERPLGVQASQISGVAAWSAREHGTPIELEAIGPRSSLPCLVAAALDDKVIAALDVRDAPGSLKEVIEKNLTFDQQPAAFCFGLLEAFDLLQVNALVLPRPVRMHAPSERARTELAALGQLYRLFGIEWDVNQPR